MDGYLLIVAGVGLLMSARAFTQVSLEVNRRVFNPRFGKALSWAGVSFGLVVGIAAIVVGVTTVV